MKALLKNYRQSPRKVRLVADVVRGKKVNVALTELEFLPKRASRAIAKLIASAKANAEHNFKVVDQDLIIQEIRVDEGPTLKRFNPVSRGRAHRINKRTSHIRLTLGLGKKALLASEAPKTEKISVKTKKTTPSKTKTTTKAPRKTSVKKSTKKSVASAK